MKQWLMDLAVETVTSPRLAAQKLLRLNPSTEVLWTAFLLVVICNALVAGISMLLVPAPTGVAEPLAIVLLRPSVFLMLQSTIVAAMIATFTFSGNILGGQGRLRDVALLLIWMQALRILVQLLVLVLSFISPMLGSLVVLLSGGLGLWILLTFLDEAHGYGSLFKSFITVFLGLIALAFLLSSVLSLFGLVPNLQEMQGPAADPFR